MAGDKKNPIICSSVADPNHFDADPVQLFTLIPLWIWTGPYYMKFKKAQLYLINGITAVVVFCIVRGRICKEFLEVNFEIIIFDCNQYFGSGSFSRCKLRIKNYMDLEPQHQFFG